MKMKDLNRTVSNKVKKGVNLWGIVWGIEF